MHPLMKLLFLGAYVYFLRRLFIFFSLPDDGAALCRQLPWRRMDDG